MTASSSAAPATYQVINAGIVLPIKCNLGFYQRMQDLLVFLVSDRTKAEIEAAHQLIEAGTTVPGTWEYQYFTALLFCKSFDTQVHEQKLYREMSPQEYEQEFGRTTPPTLQLDQAA